MQMVEDVQYAEGFANEPRRNRLDIYLPRGVARPPLVMFVHGGAWTGGSKDGWGALAQEFGRSGIAMAAINTQLHPFAEPVDMMIDCGHALAWLHTHAKEHGYDGDRLYLMGHSSGAHLVSWLALQDERLLATGVPRASLRGVIALSGVYELRPRHLALEKVFGDDPLVRAEASPFAHASAGDPPMLLLWGEHDMAGLSLCGRMLRDRLAEVGVPVVSAELAGKGHVDYVWELSVPGNRVLAQIAAFVQEPPPARLQAAPAGGVRRQHVVLGGDVLPIEVVQSSQVATASVMWIIDEVGERAAAEQLAEVLAPFGVAFVFVSARDASAASLATTWQQLRQQAKALRVPAPSFVGGLARGGLTAATLTMGVADGLRGRIVVGAALGARSIPKVWPGVAVPDLAGNLSAGAAKRPALLVVQGQGDDETQRDECVQLGSLLLQRAVEVHLVEVPKVTTAAALLLLGTADDVLLPLLRAFVLP